MATKEFGFGLKSARIAPWTAPQTWGSIISIDAVRMYSPTLETVNGRLEGDDEIAALFARFISGTVQLEFAVKNLNVFATMAGMIVADSSPTSESIIFDTTRMPYFGINGQIEHDSGAGAYEFFVPKCKLMGNLAFQAQYGQFMSQRVEAQFIRDSSVYGLAKLISRATAASPITIPPA